MPHQRTMSNCLDGSSNRIGTPQRTASLKSSGKDKPPPYRTATARQPLLLTTDPAVPVTDGGDLSSASDGNDKSGETPTTFVRGIPTAEIVGSTIKKLPKSETKSSKISKLPRSTARASLESTSECIDHTLNTSGPSVTVDTAKSPRRNSLERPSFYNTLYKSGLRSYNGSATRSLNLPVEPMANGDTALSNEQFSKLDRYLSSRPDNGDDYPTTRTYGTLGRTFSLRGPRPNKLYSPEASAIDSEVELKHRRSPTNGPAKGSGQFTSRFLRPKSFYGVSDISDYEASSPAPKPEISDLLTEGRTPFVGRRSPSYQRSISLFEGTKADNYRLSVTPDRSILGKFFPEKKNVKESDRPKLNESIETPKVRRHSRFLRPDFYDTPKEDSVYEKKEKIKNQISNGGIWKEKEKSSSTKHKKSSKKEDFKNQDNRLSIVDKAIKSLKQNTLGKIDRESMARESNLIKRAISLEDCSIVPEGRSRRSTSLTPQTNQDNKRTNNKFDKMFQKKKVEDFRKIVDYKLNCKDKEYSSSNSTPHKPDSVLKKIVRKVSPKALKLKLSKNHDELLTCNGAFENNIEEVGSYGADSRSRLSRIAGLKRLEFSRPIPSADSTPSMEEGRFNGELDDSSSVLSPTEDGSDTWSVSSDYTDAREFIPTPTIGPEDSVSERIRRKSFYSRFNQSKRRKSSSQTIQSSGSRSRLPMYSKSMSSDFTPNNNTNNPVRKISDPDKPIEN